MSDMTEIKSALERSIKTVILKPARGQKTYTNTATVRGGTLCRTVEKDQEIILDVARAMGGREAGPSPGTMLRSALSGCLALGIKLWAARAEIAIDEIEVTVEMDTDARGQLGVSEEVSPGFSGIRVNIEVRSTASPKDIQGVVDKSLRYSPLINVFSKPQHLEITLGCTEPNPA